MAVPKRRTSRSNTRHRRAQWKATPADLVPVVVAGETYDIYAIGKNDAAFPLEVTSITGLDYPAKVTVGHFAPFAATVPETAVDIKVNGTIAFTDVVYGSFVPDVALLPGTTTVEILPAGTSTVRVTEECPAASAVISCTPDSKRNGPDSELSSTLRLPMRRRASAALQEIRSSPTRCRSADKSSSSCGTRAFNSGVALSEKFSSNVSASA